MTQPPPPPFADFAPPIRQQSALRQAITEACRRPEAECIAPLLVDAALAPGLRAAVAATARALIVKLRASHRGSGVETLVQEYSLSSQEGVALMCLAEALLRIPDDATRDALIRDKIAGGDWRSHLGEGRSLFVNAATWGLVMTGRLAGSVDDRGLGAALTRLVARAGEPVIRRGVDLAMRLMGEQFVAGETIAEALHRAEPLEAKGFRYSYDMLGEAATTAADAARYLAAYESAIHAIGQASRGRGIYDGPGISIKLSALHPRYARAQADRVMTELLPRVKHLAVLCKAHDIGLNIDAEEADRLELSLDLLESLALDPELAGWEGLGFVVQAYGKRCPFVIDWLVDLARRAGRRIMVRLVKGAYWDAEIKRAQVDGLADFPVYTRKVHTDVAYIACAKRLLGAPDAVFPQFATHNAQTLATVFHFAGPGYAPGQYEFQCLHGMGEDLYGLVVGQGGLDRPCRIYAPVGTHETLLAYLVRRLLENGANSSFVHRLHDPAIPIDELIADPAEAAAADGGARHPGIALPGEVYPDRRNSRGIDLADEIALAGLTRELVASASVQWEARPQIDGQQLDRPTRPVLDPADGSQVGSAAFALTADAAQAVRAAAAGVDRWAAVPPADRAAILERAADIMEARMGRLIALIVREAGKSVPNAVAEIREAADFLRYYAGQARTTLGPGSLPLGPVVCISPWNFPLAIFTGQIAAALAAGNTVLAKPAEETTLIAAEGFGILREAGIPGYALHLLPGEGDIGAALVAAPGIAGVVFTGSTQVARAIQKAIAGRLSPAGKPIVLIAETGGLNAMIVNSSALPEQVVADVIASAFDSAGQRCSALRMLCLQEEIADRTLAMLKGAVAELRIGRTDRLAVDIGPVITAEAKARIDDHIAAMRSSGFKVEQPALPEEGGHGTFVVPTIIEIDNVSRIRQEIFGPVLHVVRYARAEIDDLIAAINTTGFGLTFGLHTRLDETSAHVTGQVNAGNIYVNRNMIGAVVGVQPFGGRGLSGTGPKAGGPLYLKRLIRNPPPLAPAGGAETDAALADLAQWLDRKGEGDLARLARHLGLISPLGYEQELHGPVGERNLYELRPRGTILIMPRSWRGFVHQLAAVLATGNEAVLDQGGQAVAGISELPPIVRRKIRTEGTRIAGALIEGSGDALQAEARDLAARPGPIISFQAADHEQLAGAGAYRLEFLCEEVSISVNTAAAGGNASLLMA